MVSKTGTIQQSEKAREWIAKDLIIRVGTRRN